MRGVKLQGLKGHSMGNLSLMHCLMLLLRNYEDVGRMVIKNQADISLMIHGDVKYVD